jgi:2,4-dienoyl-CoA reductase-like NADH-dependent reductase (Old Yellow Enzyme family)
MTQEDIDTMITEFQVAAVRAQQAGFDAIQLHGAHGFLLSQFLSPFYNHRSDRYGGTVPNRARFVLEVYQAVRKAVGTQYPIMIKMNATDFQDTGVTTDDVLQTAQLFQNVGMDNIELSGGTAWASRILRDLDRYCVRTVHEEAYYRDVAKRYKADINVPLVLTGGIRTYETAQHIVEQGIADYLGLSRPLIREPALVNRWKSGDTRRSSCVSDNACFKPALEGKGIQCVHLKK